MWTVAKAKYAAWSKNKNISSQNIMSEDISDNIGLSSGENIEENVIKQEEIALLRRELSIMSRDYREITVAYYIENQKIADISKAVNLPEGTIKRKLSESRKYLKEGINMTRTYGKRSYSPDDIRFSINRSNPIDDVPYSLIGSKLAKNILLEAYTNSCTTEELSISLGVASPYLEEELDKLVEGLLLAKTKDNKYETDFIILDKETQKNIFDKTLETAEKICDILICFSGIDAGLPVLIETMSIAARNAYRGEFTRKYIKEILGDPNLSKEEWDVIEEVCKSKLEKWKDKYTDNKSTSGEISCEDAMWFYLFKAIRDIVMQTVMGKNISTESVKKYKGEWSITGFEDYTSHEILKYPVGMDWDYNSEITNSHLFKFYFFGNESTKPTLSDIDFFADILKHGKKFSDLSETEKNMINELVKKEFAVIKDDCIKPTFPILCTSGIDEIEKYLDLFNDENYPDKAKEHDKMIAATIQQARETCLAAIFELYEYNLAQIKIGLSDRLYEQAKYCARDMLHYLYNAILKYAMEREHLKITDNSIGIGAYVVN